MANPVHIKFVKQPSLAALGGILSKRFKKGVTVQATQDGLEFTFETDPTPGDLTRLETMMERLGYVQEE